MKLGKEFLSFCLVGVVMLGIVLGFPTKVYGQERVITNVVVAIDVEGILEDHCTPTVNGGVIEWVDCKGTELSPQIVDNRLIHMLANNGRAYNLREGAELTISAFPSDVIRWSSTSFSNNELYNIVSYKFSPTRRRIRPDVLDTPKKMVIKKCVAVPMSEARQDIPSCGSTPVVNYGGIDYTLQRQDGDFWEATVLAFGRQKYTFDFTVLDRKGETHGFYRLCNIITNRRFWIKL
ncbi:MULTISPECIES: AidA/PixA family protein [unclassified Moorena]|uniref:AidA/PixA family protein n=1 Tax=unclassified Moorena TaxID=2683338 RepID=UPI0013BD808E|nr:MULTISPECIES: AidA/PixA family protein [unclassified Moorena]NER91157.1 hypothetical protein [Moorena sp. SIO3A2]NET65136.1 hypothetical protein [Moorena sp. SIO1G6]